eukprot:UN28703
MPACSIEHSDHVIDYVFPTKCEDGGKLDASSRPPCQNHAKLQCQDDTFVKCRDGSEPRMPPKHPLPNMIPQREESANPKELEGEELEGKMKLKVKWRTRLKLNRNSEEEQ